jgi:hypothetical protein
MFRTGQATEDNMANEYYMLVTKGYKHTHSENVILVAYPLQQWII